MCLEVSLMCSNGPMAHKYTLSTPRRSGECGRWFQETIDQQTHSYNEFEIPFRIPNHTSPMLVLWLKFYHFLHNEQEQYFTSAATRNGIKDNHNAIKWRKIDHFHSHMVSNRNRVPGMHLPQKWS